MHRHRLITDSFDERRPPKISEKEPKTLEEDYIGQCEKTSVLPRVGASYGAGHNKCRCLRPKWSAPNASHSPDPSSQVTSQSTRNTPFFQSREKPYAMVHVQLLCARAMVWASVFSLWVGFESSIRSNPAVLRYVNRSLNLQFLTFPPISCHKLLYGLQCLLRSRM